jgi:tetratricopeptide (TPR) repeat protein
LQLAACLYACRDFQSAADHCWQMLSLWPDFAPAQMLLALAYEKLEMYEESIVEFQNARLSSACRIPALSGLSAVCALAGLHTQSELAHRELTTESTTRHVSTYWHAVICVARQQTSQALDFLETSLQQRDPTLLWLPSDARFDHLRHSPRLQKLCQTVF